MKILVLTNRDSDNIRIVNVLRELKKRGHTLGIYCVFMDDQNIRMLKGIADELHSIKNLSSKIIESYDIIFVALHTQRFVKFADKYVFFFNHYFDNHWLTQGADFMFTASKNRDLPFREDCACMAVGDPKNDTIQTSSASASKRLLFIDSGHFPFGRKGKEQVADMLLEICDKFPDYELCIKPRWLPNQNENVTHRNSLHLYDVIKERCTNGKVPPNLNMLQEHLDMQELVDGSICVIVTCTSAYHDVVLRGKNIIIAKGFETEDMYSARRVNEFEAAYEQQEDSGCVVDYKDVMKYLPYGLKCNDKHIDRVLAYRNGASKRMADIMEYIYSEFISHGKYPAIKDYDYEHFHTEIIEDSSVTLDLLKRKRMRNVVLDQLNMHHYINAPLDFTVIYNQFDDICMQYPISESGYSKFNKDIKLRIRKLIISNKDLLMRDEIDQSRLLEVLYLSGLYEDILSIPEEKVLCISPYHYYLACYNKFGPGSRTAGPASICLVPKLQ